MKQDPTRAFLVRVIVISALATFVWGACFVAICVFVLWAAQSLGGDSGVEIPTWIVLELGFCVGAATAGVVLWRRVVTEPRKLADRGELAPTPPFVAHAVEGVSLALGVPEPELLVIDDDCPNAAAAGSRKRSVVVVTTGMVAALTGPELEAVIGHLMSRVDTHAVTLATTAAALTGDIIEYHDYARGKSWPIQVWAMGFGYPLVALASLLRWWALRDEAQISDLHALRTVRNTDALLGAMEKLIADRTEPSEADLRNAHLWFEYPTSAVGDLPGPSHRLEAHLVLEARVDQLNDALGAGFVR